MRVIDKKGEKGPLVNRDIRAPRVRLIDENGKQVGIVSTKEALDYAKDRGLDLVQVNARGDPPVCRVMDYGRYKYEQKKKAREARKKQHQMLIKELKLRPKTDKHDVEIKLRHARRFLEDGHAVKLTMRFRGREIIYAEEAAQSMNRLAEQLEDVGQLRQIPTMEGRQLTMLLIPRAHSLR